ncbi:MAG: hypothetical protein HY360_13710 [Verrucomicrobia bacterium]|nr:hypothetical protein [Verrucomicrobiota bacterium]
MKNADTAIRNADKNMGRRKRVFVNPELQTVLSLQRFQTHAITHHYDVLYASS